MGRSPANAGEVTGPDAPIAVGEVQVAWIGPRPAWLDDAVASPSLAGFSVDPERSATTRVVHLGRHAATTVAEVRAAQDLAVVIELGQIGSMPEEQLRDAVGADVVLVDSELEAQRARSRAAALDGKVVVAPGPLDLAWHAPEAALARLPGGYIKRFRRLHRLAPPTVLFVGPYTHAGGLDLAIAAAYRLRGRFEDLRLAAIPLGPVDRKFLDRCEMDALGLGHRGIVEWTCSHEEARFWYATATVVCSPWRAATDIAAVPLLAAAAGRPFVGSDVSALQEGFRAPGAPGLVRPDDVDALVEALEPLLSDSSVADELGRTARETVEASVSYRAAAERLRQSWTRALERRTLTRAA